ncbi:MAG: hypothetical protein IK070_00845, partial [Clostridia bacterium]|nr:hypothetical protein [Clostridia bacterium]
NNVFLDITFIGTRELGGSIETTTTTIMVQVVYVKIDRVNLVGSYVDGVNDLFLIRTGESSALQLALYSTNDSHKGGLLANQRAYLNAIADVFSGHLTLDQVKKYIEKNKVIYDTEVQNGGYYNPYGVVKGDNIEPINDETVPQFRYSHVEMQALNNGNNELYTYWEVQGTLISQVKLCATLDYYYDDNGYIQAYDGVSPKLAGRNYYTIRYFFILVIADGSTEDRPLPISNQSEFEAMLDNNEGSFILKSDIVLENYKPRDINVDLLDGNSFRIILKSFSEDSFEQSSTLGLFKSVGNNTMIKNLMLDIGQFYYVRSEGSVQGSGIHLLDLTNIVKTNASTQEAEILDVTSLSFAFFAVTNSGCITNCAVIDTKGEESNTNVFHIKTNQKATGTTTFEAQVAGFVLTNSGSISNSYIGIAVNDNGLIEVGYTESNGEQSEHLTTIQTNAFDIYAGQKVAGFVLTNSGTISNSYAKGVGITNLSEKAYNSYTAGFVGNNTGKVYNSFAEAERIANFRPDEDTHPSYGWQIQAVGSAAGFVYTNSGDIQNAYSKLTIQVNSVNTGGFVYTNDGSIKNAYTTTINAAGIGAGSLAHGPFIGVAWSSTGAKQYGTLEHCYYLILDDEFGLGDDADKALEILESIDPAKPIMSNSFDGTGANFQTATPFEGFSITNNNDENTLSDYLWYVNTSATTAAECQGPTIVGATRKTISYRIHLGIKTQIDPVTGNEVEYNAYKWLGGYNFGSKRNPIVISTADSFVKSIIENSKSYTYVDEQTNTTERFVIFGSSNSAYNSVYAPSYVRIVNDIDLNEQALNTMYYVQGTNVRYKISDLIFMGQIDGNGMTVSGIKLTSTDQNMRENYGLFSQIGLSGSQKETKLTNGGKLGQHANQTPRLFNINFEYKEISNKNAQKVGLLAGSIYDATLRMISITGPESEVTDKVSVISGWNLVGGAAGLISGANTNISDITLKNIRIIANKNTIDVDPDYINLSGYYDEFEQAQSGAGKVKATRLELDEADNDGVYSIKNLEDISYAGSFAGVILANNYKTFTDNKKATIDEDTGAASANAETGKTLLEVANTPEYLNLQTLGAEQNAVALRHVGSIHNITTTGIIDITSDNSSAMFGYVGNNTHISDAQVIIDTTQSGAYYHVYGHNFAGGIAAEMVGGVLERAEVRHDEAKQEDIDSKINKSTPAMISRLDFFKSSDSTKVNNTSISIGGIAGYTESSILLDTYSKINVTNEDSRIAGGVIGYANKFNYLGFVYTVGDVLAKEVIGGLVGLYTYNDYKLYLQEAFALNRWGSEIKNQSIFTKLKTNYYAIYGETYAQAQAGGRAHALTLPEIGNMYNGGKADQKYGDNLTGASSDSFTFIGSTIGKASLLPGTYRVDSYTFVIGGAVDGETKGLLYTSGSNKQALTNATSTGTYKILKLYPSAKYVKNLFVNTDGESGDDKISMPLYMEAKYDSEGKFLYYAADHYVGASKDATTGEDIIYVGDNKKALPVPATTAGTEEINKYFNVLSSTYNPTDSKKSGSNSIYRIAQKVLDKSVYFNKFNYNVFSTTYGVLSESKVTASVYKMTYTGGNSFVLPNSNMGDIYQITNVEKNGSANISDEIKNTLVGGSDTGIIRYNSILGKQTYFEMITGYFFSNGTGDFNSNYYKFNNEFDTQYGFTKYMKENKNNNGDVSSYTPDGSGTWYKKGLNEVYFPEYSYGKHSSFIKISTSAELAEEFGDDTAGKFYSLAPAEEYNNVLTLNITTNRPQQFNNEFAGIIIGKTKDNANPKIRINANTAKGVTTFLRSIENATFVNVDIEVYVKNIRSFASTDTYNGNLTSFGTIARYVENTIFNNCNFTVICDKPVNNDDYFKLTDSAVDALTDFGFVFGETYGADFSDCTFTFKFCEAGNPQAEVSDENIKIQIGNVNSGATTGNYGVFIGKADGIGISNVGYSCPNVSYVVNNEAPLSVHQNNINLGMVFGSVQNSAFIDGIYSNRSDANTFTVSGTARVKDDAFANVGVLTGSIISSTVKNTYTPVSTLTTNLTVTSPTENKGHYLAVGVVAGFVQSGTITDVQSTMEGYTKDSKDNIVYNNITYSNKNQISVTGGKATQLHLGAIFGLCDVSIVTNTNLQVVNTKLNVNNSCDFTNTFVGGIMGSTGALGTKTGVPTQVDYEATVTTSISNYVYAGEIIYKSNKGTYNVGGIVGNAKQTNILNTINVANIDVTSSSNSGTAGGLVAIMTLPRRSTNVSIQNNMAYGHLKFDMTSNNKDNSRFGGFIGKMATTSDRGTFKDNYSYTYMDYTIAESESGGVYSLAHYDYAMYDIISTSPLDLFKDVMYINEMMPARANTDAAKGNGYDYQNWHALSNVVPKSLTSTNPIDTNTILEYILVGQGNNQYTIFNPSSTLSSLSAAEANKVYYITSLSSIGSGTIAKDAMIIGQKLTNITGDYAELESGARVIMLSPAANTQIVNNGMISGFAFHLASNNIKTLFLYNNGVIYNTMVYGTLNSAISGNFASLVDNNFGYVVNVNASTTYTGDSVNFNYSGLVYTNNGAIHRVVSTSGALSLASFDSDKTYAPIVAVNTSQKVTSALFGGVMAFKNVNNNSNITICSTSSTGSAGSTIKYEDLVASTSSFAYTANSKYAIQHSYNFGMPYLKTAAKIPSRVKAVGSQYDLYTTDGGIVLVRTLTDVVKSNIEINGCSSSGSVSKESIGKFDYIVCANIALSDYQGKYSDHQVIRFNNANNIEGNNHTFDGSGLQKTGVLAGSLNIGKNEASATDYLAFVQNYIIKNFNVKGSGNIALVGKTTSLNNVSLDNITVTASGKVSYMGAVLKANSSSYLTATNITLKSEANNGDTTDGVGTIAWSAGNVNNSALTIININTDGKFTKLANVGALVGKAENGNIQSNIITGVNITGQNNVGGVLGIITSAGGYVKSNELKGTNSISANANVGGIVGKSEREVSNNSVTSLTINIATGKKQAYVGGVIGNQSGTANSNAVTSTTINFACGSESGYIGESNKYYVGGVIGGISGNQSGNSFTSGHIEVTNLPKYKDTQTKSLGNKSLTDLDDTFNISYNTGSRTASLTSLGNIAVLYPVEQIAIKYICGNVATDSGTTTSSTMTLKQSSLALNDNYSGVIIYFKVDFKAGYSLSSGMDTWWDDVMWADANKGIYFEDDNSLFGNNGYDLIQNLKIVIGKNKEVTVNNDYKVPNNYDARVAMSSGAHQEDYASHQYWAYIYPYTYTSYDWWSGGTGYQARGYDSYTVRLALWNGWDTKNSWKGSWNTPSGSGIAGYKY